MLESRARELDCPLKYNFKCKGSECMLWVEESETDERMVVRLDRENRGLSQLDEVYGDCGLKSK